jgi:peptidoglycan/LPS O-acetylase OafA/YrhL
LQFPRKQLKRLIFLSYSILLICIMFFHFFDQGVVKTQLFKFPPRIYYVSYALSVSFTLLYLTLHTPIFNKLKYNGVIQFIGRSTMWIYLWHWFSLKLYFCIPFKTNVLIKYLFIFSVAILIAFIQQKIIQKITHSMNIGPSKQKMLRTVFTG